ncbi:uncharacterized protein LOC143783164 isoform X1 [Ranitomeya variabilis]|uniref:uncharacterized protein LOC143783164 isoform X1 n=1 Tax=Ranitomeya variabilis TaxID=490064 RepID=UPI004056FA96
MSTLTRMALLCLAALLIVSTVAAQEETVTIVDTTPPIESSIAENEEITDVPQQTETKSAAETTMLPAEDPVSFQGSQRLQTDGTGESASSNSESSNSENNDSVNVETMQGGPVLDIPAESLESKEDPDPESEESFTLPAGK